MGVTTKKFINIKKVESINAVFIKLSPNFIELQESFLNFLHLKSMDY